VWNRTTHSPSHKFNIFYSNINSCNNCKYKKQKYKIKSSNNYIFGVLGAIVGANLSIHTDVYKLRKMFGIFLAIIAIHEIYTIYKEHKKTKKG